MLLLLNVFLNSLNTVIWTSLHAVWFWHNSTRWHWSSYLTSTQSKRQKGITTHLRFAFTCLIPRGCLLPEQNWFQAEWSVSHPHSWNASASCMYILQQITTLQQHEEINWGLWTPLIWEFNMLLHRTFFIDVHIHI